MILTTEPTFTGKKYVVLRIVHTCAYMQTAGWLPGLSIADQVSKAMETALGKLADIAGELHADSVIGIHHNAWREDVYTCISVMGTAIKFV